MSEAKKTPEQVRKEAIADVRRMLDRAHEPYCDWEGGYRTALKQVITELQHLLSSPMEGL